jgi:hypothetical protein
VLPRVEDGVRDLKQYYFDTLLLTLLFLLFVLISRLRIV